MNLIGDYQPINFNPWILLRTSVKCLMSVSKRVFDPVARLPTEILYIQRLVSRADDSDWQAIFDLERHISPCSTTGETLPSHTNSPVAASYFQYCIPRACKWISVNVRLSTSELQCPRARKWITCPQVNYRVVPVNYSVPVTNQLLVRVHKWITVSPCPKVNYSAPVPASELQCPRARKWCSRARKLNYSVPVPASELQCPRASKWIELDSVPCVNYHAQSQLQCPHARKYSVPVPANELVSPCPQWVVFPCPQVNYSVPMPAKWITVSAVPEFWVSPCPQVNYQCPPCPQVNSSVRQCEWIPGPRCPISEFQCPISSARQRFCSVPRVRQTPNNSNVLVPTSEFQCSRTRKWFPMLETGETMQLL